MTYGYNIILKLQNRNINIIMIYSIINENIVTSLSDKTIIWSLNDIDVDQFKLSSQNMSLE